MKSIRPKSPSFIVLLAAFLGISALASVNGRAAINLTTFGSDVDVFGSWSYDPGTSTLSGTTAPADTLYPVAPSTWDFSALGSPGDLVFQLTGFVTTSPGGGFQITIEDGDGNSTATDVDFSLFTTTSSTVEVLVSTLSAPGAIDWSSIQGWNIVSSVSGPIDATFTSLDVNVIPEPSTYALLALSGLAFGGYVVRRRHRS